MVPGNACLPMELCLHSFFETGVVCAIVTLLRSVKQHLNALLVITCFPLEMGAVCKLHGLVELVNRLEQVRMCHSKPAFLDRPASVDNTHSTTIRLVLIGLFVRRRSLDTLQSTSLGSTCQAVTNVMKYNSELPGWVRGLASSLTAALFIGTRPCLITRRGLRLTQMLFVALPHRRSEI